MRHRLIPAALAAGASLVLLGGTAVAATPTWTVVPSVNPSATTLNAVSARTSTDAWAVGQFPGAGDDAGAQIFAERWNGTQWQQTPTTNIVRQDERLLGVSAHWNGTAWSVLPGPTGSDPNTVVTGLSALPLGEAWATGATFSATAATAFIAHHTP
jgi:hypothetical protein